MTLALRYAARSDVGLLREGNEDAAYAGPHLLVVADGMGGYEAGEVASSTAIAAMAPLDRSPVPQAELIKTLTTAMAGAKETLRRIADADPAVGAMGTTLTAMLWSGETAAICHIGDSRAYLLRDGSLYQVTRDHSFVQQLIDQGRIRPDEAATHPQRSLLLRALDGRNDADPDLSLLTAHEGDRVLLCSDGLPVVVTDEDIGQTLNEIADPADTVRRLIELAISGGGPDNITCIVADLIDPARSVLPPTVSPIAVGAAAYETEARFDTKPIAVPVGQAPTEVADTGTLSGDVASARLPAERIADARATQGRHASRKETSRPPAAPAAQGRDRNVGAGGGSDDGDSVGAETRPVRRRWPVVTTILALFVLLVGGGLALGYQYVHSQYYVGTNHGAVVIYRGVNERLLGIALSSVVARTGIPESGVPRSDLHAIRDPVSTGLTEAQRVVANIRRDYQACKDAYSALRRWKAGKPKPETKKVLVNGKLVTKTITPPYHKPKPGIPSYCPPGSAYAS